MTTEITQAEELGFKDMVLARTRGWATTYDEQNYTRIMDAVTLTQRKRGDYFGFASRKGSRSFWNSFDGKGMATYPIVERAIKSKTATSVATEIKLNLEAWRKLPEKEAGVEVASSISNFVCAKLWTKDFEAIISELPQINRYCGIFSHYNPQGGMKVELPETERRDVKTGITQYMCPECGNEYAPEDLGIEDIVDKTLQQQTIKEAQVPAPLRDLPGTTDASAPKQLTSAAADVADSDVIYGDAFLPPESNPLCPECNSELHLTASAKYEKILALTGDYYSAETGEPDARIISPLLLRIDSYKCLGFKYSNADWFNFHPLVPMYEVLRLAPELKDKVSGGSHKWSESARWHYELAHNSSGNSQWRANGYALDELTEINFWWITPKACHGWKSPEHYEHEGFTIHEGETIEESAIRQFGKFQGLMVMIVNEEVIPIGNKHFLENWNFVPWKIDAQSFFPQGEENLLHPQDQITNILSMVTGHVNRTGNPKLIVNTLRFAEKDVKKNMTGQIITTNQAVQETENSDWRRDIGYLQPADLSSAVYQLIELIITIGKEMSGVFDETVGNAQGAETLGGRRMALSQSLSLMTPTQQSKAMAKIDWVFTQLKLWQENAPDEAFILLKGTFEEEWKEADIEAFRALDIDKEIMITVIEGTDVPKSQLEMENRFMIARDMGLLEEPNPLPLEIRNHIVKRVLGIDYDISNFAATKRQAARRHAVIIEELQELSSQDAITITTDLTGMPVRQLRPEIIASIAQAPNTSIETTDDHLSFISYWTDQLNGIKGAKEQNEVMLFAIRNQIDMHRAQLAASATQAAAAQSVADNTGAMIGNAQTPPPMVEGSPPPG